MISTKTIVTGGLLAVIAALFQSVPVLFSEIFVFVTIFSAVPIYIISRMSPRIGFLSYIVASMLIMLISTHEALFFLFTNGIVGVCLGICSYYTNRKLVICSVSSLLLTAALSIMNYGVGIPVFGAAIPGVMIIQLGILFLFSLVYSIVYYYFSNIIFKVIKKANKR